MLKPRSDSEDQRFLNGSSEFGHPGLQLPSPLPPPLGPDNVNIYFNSRDMRFQSLGKNQHENCQFCTPLTNTIMSQVEKTHISGRN